MEETREIGPVERLQDAINNAIQIFMSETQVPINNIKILWDEIDTSSLEGPSRMITYLGSEITFGKV